VSIDISVSIVHYGNNTDDLDTTLASLSNALRTPPVVRECRVALVDNGPGNWREILEAMLLKYGLSGVVLSGHGNVGYGEGNNLAFFSANDSTYHLVLNPDMELAPDALARAVAFMEENPDCGLLTPSFSDREGNRLYLCKRYPSVAVLAFRALAPALLKGPVLRLLHHYEMRDIIKDTVVWDTKIVSGCFMFFRSGELRRLGGFDKRYFLYFEDFDISLRMAVLARIAYDPDVHVVHFGGGAASKGLKHIYMFCRSASLFFNTYGWKFI
jgi:GT2 family glycosyltransferase